MFAFTAQTAAPIKQVMDSVERIVRNGYAPDLVNGGGNWTAGSLCPAAHWIAQQNSSFHRNDDPDIELRPCVVIGALSGAKPTYETAREIWDVPVFVEVRYSRNYAPDDAQTLANQLESVMTHGLTPTPTTWTPAKTMLSFAVAGVTPGLNVLHIYDVNTQTFRSDDKSSAVILTTEFTVRCSAMASI